MDLVNDLFTKLGLPKITIPSSFMLPFIIPNLNDFFYFMKLLENVDVLFQTLKEDGD